MMSLKNKARNQQLTTTAMRSVTLSLLVLLASFVVADGSRMGGEKKTMMGMKGMKGMMKTMRKDKSMKMRMKMKMGPAASGKTRSPSPVLTLQPTFNTPTVVPTVAPVAPSSVPESTPPPTATGVFNLRDPTTPFDLLDPDMCFFQDLVFPDVANQCSCFNTVAIVPADVEMMYNTLAVLVEEVVYPEGFDFDITSCESPLGERNQALLWLSQNDARANSDVLVRRNLQVQAPDDIIQRYLLALFYYATGGPNWTNATNWLTSASECTWLGVACEDTSDSGRVTSIELPSNNLGGSLPEELAQLTALQSIELPLNMISSTLPSSIGSIETLTSLSLNDNLLVRKIPTEFGMLSSLQTLQINNNRFSGNIPTEFGLLAGLQVLDASDTLLFGEIPTELGQATALTEILLGRSGVGGTLPSSLTMLLSLETLEIQDNNFQGTLYPELESLRSLRALDLSGNSFTGTIPPRLGFLTRLETLLLQDNAFTGTIPALLGTGLEQVTRIDFSQNNLTGDMPSDICNLRDTADGMLSLLVADCVVNCEIPVCCSFCRQ